MRELWPYLRELRGALARRLLLGLLLAWCAMAAAVALLGLSGWFITMAAIVGIIGSTTFSYVFASGGVRALALLRTLARYGERVVNHETTCRWLARLRVRCFAQALRLPAPARARYRSGELLSRIMADVDTLDHLLLRTLIPTVSTAVLVVAATGFIAWYSAMLGLVVAAAALVVGVGLPLLAARGGRAAGAQGGAAREAARSEVIEALEGMPEIISYGAQATVQSRIGARLAAADATQWTQRRGCALSQAATTATSGGAVLLVLWLGLTWVGRDRFPIALVPLIALILIGVLEQAETLPPAYQFWEHVRAAARRLDVLFWVPDPIQPQAARLPFPADQPIHLRQVRFRYDGQQQDTLQGLTLDIRCGTLVALTGTSGAGKSTLLQILAGELRPMDGGVYIGDVPLDRIARDDLVRHLGYVAQDSHLFNGSLRDNLLLAQPDAGDEELHNMLAAVGLTSLVDELGDGLDSWIGEHGAHLSGGQRRRVSLAQVLLRQPRLLLLDEPTTGVDQPTVLHILAAVRQLLPTSTIIIATHDPLIIARSQQRIHLGADQP